MLPVLTKEANKGSKYEHNSHYNANSWQVDLKKYAEPVTDYTSQTQNRRLVVIKLSV